MRDAFSDYHPLCNLVFFIGVIGVSVFVVHPVMLGISFVCALSWLIVLKGAKKAVGFSLVLALPVALIAAFANPLFNHYGVTILAWLPTGNALTLESMVYGLVMGVMMITVILWFSCLTEVMTSDKFIYLFGRILPAFSLLLSMTLRFVPVFYRRSRLISDARKCVGKGGREGNLIERMRQGMANFSILVTWSLENAVDTADSMKCRGYGLPGRTSFAIYKVSARDRVCLAFMAVSFAGMLVLMGQGAVSFSYNPRIRIGGLPPTPQSGAVFLLYTLFALLPVVLSVWQKITFARLQKQAGSPSLEGYRLWETSSK